jgi:metal-responsive CopG/Arc/MetJ family transcriptional regulator
MGEPRRNRVTVVMEDSLKSNVDALAETNNRTVSDFIRLVLREYVEAIQEAEGTEEAT